MKTLKHFWLWLILGSLGIFSPAWTNLTQDEELALKQQFHWAAVFFKLQEKTWDRSMRTDWVKQTLLGLASEENSNVEPELCGNFGSHSLLNFIKSYHVNTDLEIIKAGSWLQKWAAQNGLGGHQLTRATQIAVLWNNLKRAYVFEDFVKRLASEDQSPIENKIDILLSQKQRFPGYCEVGLSWEAAPMDMRNVPQSFTKLYLHIVKEMALKADMSEKYQGFVEWMRLSDIDAQIDLGTNPIANFKNELENEAKVLGIFDVIDNYDSVLPSPNLEQLHVIEMVKSEQLYSVISSMMPFAQDGNIRPELANFDYYSDAREYLEGRFKRDLQEKLRQELNRCERDNPSEGKFRCSLRFLLNERDEIQAGINRVNEVNHHYNISLNEFKRTFKEVYLKNKPNNGDPLGEQSFLRWLKTMCNQLGMMRSFEAYLELFDLADKAPASDDFEDVYSWLARGLSEGPIS